MTPPKRSAKCSTRNLDISGGFATPAAAELISSADLSIALDDLLPAERVISVDSDGYRGTRHRRARRPCRHRLRWPSTGALDAARQQSVTPPTSLRGGREALQRAG